MAQMLLGLAAVVLVLAWTPLIAVGALVPQANPIGLGLLALAGSLIAVVLVIAAIIAAIWRRIR